MLPNENDKNFLKDENKPQLNSTFSFLNVNASEFYPSMAVQRQELNDSVSITFGHYSTDKNEDAISSKMKQFSPVSFIPQVTEKLEDDVVCSQQHEFEHSAYSILTHMQRIEIGSGTNAHSSLSQRQASTQQFHVNNEETANLNKQKYSHSDYTSLNQMQKRNISFRNNEATILNWQEIAPIPCLYDNFFMDEEFLERYREACDTAILPGDEWDVEPEPNDAEINVAPSGFTEIQCDLNTESKNLLKKLQETAGALLQSESNGTDGTLLPAETDEDNNNEIKVDKNDDNIIDSVEAEATVKDKEIKEEDIKEEAQPLVMFKQSKKKNKTRVKEVCSKKEHVNIVFIGHVDAGKSTLGGQLMFLTGMVDKRTMNKYEKEAKEISRDSWYLSWALDTNQEERDKGKTVETGRGHFETETKHFTILDAPGHKSFVPNMICGAAQADIAVLVLSARHNEFESGFVKGGQTRDHAVLARSAGLNVLIALVNKMDDSTVKWNENRFNYCKTKTLPFLKKLGYAPKDVYFIPISAQTGDGLVTAVPKKVCPWFKGPCFIECLEKLSPITRLYDSPFVMPIAERFKDMGTVVMGKVEAGSIQVSKSLLLMPNKVTVSVEQIWSDNKEVTLVRAGENVKIRLKGVEDEEISPGFVLCDIKKPITTATLFDAQLHILDCKSIITPGYSAVMHFQSVAEDITVTHLMCLVDPKTNVKTRKHNLQFVKKNDEAIMRIQCSGVVCLTTFKEFNPLGRFTLRDDNKVIAIGKVLKIIKM